MRVAEKAKEWAKNEIALAVKQEEVEHSKDHIRDYLISAYNFTGSVFNYVMDSHIPLSLFNQIFERLVQELPLTPIEDVPETWDPNPLESNDGSKIYICKRKPSLSKVVKADGSISYTDYDRVYCVDLKQPLEKGKEPYRIFEILQILDRMAPITMPYYPKGKYVAITNYISFNPTEEYIYLSYFVTPEKNILHANICLKKVYSDMISNENGDYVWWQEIPFEQYSKEIQIHERKENEEKWQSEGNITSGSIFGAGPANT